MPLKTPGEEQLEGRRGGGGEEETDRKKEKKYLNKK